MSKLGGSLERISAATSSRISSLDLPSPDEVRAWGGRERGREGGREGGEGGREEREGGRKGGREGGSEEKKGEREG